MSRNFQTNIERKLIDVAFKAFDLREIYIAIPSFHEEKWKLCHASPIPRPTKPFAFPVDKELGPASVCQVPDTPLKILHPRILPAL